ncbi:unnamed protein product [Blepharisma stoltei]|uniref:FBA domain-containing protein n=1 Tax=Blepharisma stoltei TaxID=1481888 RepID=A0AAU9I8G9_9CILI|nr:unnamed protein product [Blepharisma stoltei]
MGNHSNSPVKKNQMNENELIIIFRRASSFLSPTDSLKLLSLNHFFHQHLPNHEFYFYVSKPIASWIANLDQNDPDVFDHFARFLECNPFTSYDDLFNCIKSSQNMIKNPCGEMGFNSWEKHNGGDGWNIEDWPGYRHKKTVFTTSYEWCDLTQTISIPLSDQKRFLIVGAYVTRRSDCGALAKLKVQAYDKNKNLKDTYKIDEVNIREPGPALYMLKTKIEIQPYHRIFKITYSGKDTNWWAGTYGARFSYCYARISYSL